MPKEVWKKIDFIEGIDENSYEISNLGRVKSLPKKNRKSEIFLNPRVSGRDGSDKKVTLQSDKCYKNVSIGRLVAMAFIPNENNYKYVKHRDNNNDNNCVENLEWCKKSDCSTNRKANLYIRMSDDVYKLIIDNNIEIIFDANDYELVSSYHWRINNYGYAQSKNIMMHRIILGNPDGVVDHINHNRNDNRKKNLRICTKLQNAQNRDTRYAKYGVFGVYPLFGKWTARIQHEGKKYNLGTFETYEEAAKTRIEKEIELFGEYSSQKYKLNNYL